MEIIETVRACAKNNKYINIMLWTFMGIVILLILFNCYNSKCFHFGNYVLEKNINHIKNQEYHYDIETSDKGDFTYIKNKRSKIFVFIKGCVWLVFIISLFSGTWFLIRWALREFKTRIKILFLCGGFTNKQIYKIKL